MGQSLTPRGSKSQRGWLRGLHPEGRKLVKLAEKAGIEAQLLRGGHVGYFREGKLILEVSATPSSRYGRWLEQRVRELRNLGVNIEFGHSPKHKGDTTDMPASNARERELGEQLRRRATHIRKVTGLSINDLAGRLQQTLHSTDASRTTLRNERLIEFLQGEREFKSGPLGYLELAITVEEKRSNIAYDEWGNLIDSPPSKQHAPAPVRPKDTDAQAWMEMAEAFERELNELKAKDAALITALKAENKAYERQVALLKSDQQNLMELHDEELREAGQQIAQLQADRDSSKRRVAANGANPVLDALLGQLTDDDLAELTVKVLRR